jgi:hypothetical protein
VTHDPPRLLRVTQRRSSALGLRYVPCGTLEILGTTDPLC